MNASQGNGGGCTLAVASEDACCGAQWNTARHARVDLEDLLRDLCGSAVGNLPQGVCAQGRAGAGHARGGDCRESPASPRMRTTRDPGIERFDMPCFRPLPFAVHSECGCSDDKGVDKPRKPASQAGCQRVIRKSPHGAWLSRCALELRARVWVCSRKSRAGAQPAGSDHTANSLPLGSAKWNRRPPGKSNTGLRMVPPAACTFARVSSMRSL